MPGKRLVIVLGPTAVGKTDYSISLAQKYGSPVISCDSRQIYREMSIGTAVPDKDQLALVTHYFIHSHSVENLYTAGKYEVEALKLINELFEEKDKTGYYKNAYPPYKSSRKHTYSTKSQQYYRVEEKQGELFSFDPNTADSTQLLRLGLRPWQVRNIYKYRAAGGRYRKPTDFARLYGLTLKQYQRLEPYIRIEQEVMAADVYGKGERQNTHESQPAFAGE